MCVCVCACSSALRGTLPFVFSSPQLQPQVVRLWLRLWLCKPERVGAQRNLNVAKDGGGRIHTRGQFDRLGFLMRHCTGNWHEWGWWSGVDCSFSFACTDRWREVGREKIHPDPPRPTHLHTVCLFPFFPRCLSCTSASCLRKRHLSSLAVPCFKVRKEVVEVVPRAVANLMLILQSRPGTAGREGRGK